MSDFFSDPNLQHPVLTPQEMAMICDCCNPAFALDRELGDDLVAQSVQLSVSDSFRLYPGTYESKWRIDREVMITKLATMSRDDLLLAADRVDKFWKAVRY